MLNNIRSKYRACKTSAEHSIGVPVTARVVNFFNLKYFSKSPTCPSPLTRNQDLSFHDRPTTYSKGSFQLQCLSIHRGTVVAVVVMVVVVVVLIGHRGSSGIKVKIKFSLEQATKAQRGSRCIALLFLQHRC